MKEVKEIVIVGGGTSGLTTALILKSKLPTTTIKVIKSSKEGIIGVGEGTTRQWEDFINITNIDFKEVIAKTDATVKTGILFNDWNYKGHTYIHSLTQESSIYSLDSAVLSPNSHPYKLSPHFKKLYFNNNIPIIRTDLKSSKQYHFDTLKLNKFLIEKCLERKIIIEDHFVKDVILNNKGYIDKLITSQNYKIGGDFFIDCSGFKRILISKLNPEFISYREYLPVNTAITLPTSLNPLNIEPYTTATALSSGWAWKIPTQTRYGNGYVFDNRYISSDQALNEFNTHLGINAEKVAKEIQFEAGKLNKYWINNCIAIGLSGSFIEPLEAQSIGYSIQQARIFAESIINWQISPNLISKTYNERLDIIFDNILNLVQIHYFTKREDSKFWKDKPFKLTQFNKDYLNLFSKGLIDNSYFNFKDFEDNVFIDYNYYMVLYGLGIINKNNIQSKYNMFPSLLPHLKIGHNLYNEALNHAPNSISHTDYLKLIKENYSS